MPVLVEWLENNFWELFGTLAALIYLYFSIKQKIWLWPWGIITSLVYIFVFFKAKFYADMGLNVYYVAISIYGWYHWKRGSTNTQNELPVAKTPRKRYIPIMLSSLLIYFVIYYILRNYTDSPVPVGDSFTTAFSIVATWMLARKYIEQWIFWVVIDLVSMALYIYKDLWITSGLFFIYSLLAVYGYFEWNNNLKTETPNP